MEYEEGSLPETWKKFRQGKKPVEEAPLDIWVWYCPVIGEGTSSFVCSTCGFYKKQDGCKYFDLIFTISLSSIHCLISISK